MMSKNNVVEISKRVFNQSPCYALRKLSVGVASVLIGTTMYAGLAHADTIAVNNELAPIERVPASATTLSSSNDKATSSAGDSDGSGQVTASPNIDNKVISNTNTQRFSFPAVNRLAINSTNQQAENSLQASFVQSSNNPDWTRNGYYQARASNVDFQLTDSYGRSGNGVGAEIPTEISLGFSNEYHVGIKAYFDLNTSDLVVNNKVYLGSIGLSNSLNDVSHNIQIAKGGDGEQLGALMYQGQLLGQLYKRAVDNSLTDLYLLVTNNNQFVTPKLTVTNWVNQDITAYNWNSDSSVYKGVPANFVENLTMPGGKTYHFNLHYSYYNLNDFLLHSLHFVGTHSFNLYDYAAPTFAVDGGYSGQSLTPADFAVLNNRNGEGLVLPNIGYQAAYTYRPSIVGAFPSWISLACSLYVKGADGKITNDLVYMYNMPINYANVGNGYTLAELKSKSQPGTAIYSLQNDGTYLCYVNLSPQQLVMSESSVRNALLQSSKIIAMQGDKALQNTLNLYFGKAFNGRAFSYQIATVAATTSSYDQLTVSNVQALKVDDGHLLIRGDTWHSVPDISQVAGKAAIRVHYINGYNGQQIGNSQIFNDDQGKTLSYQAQNSLGAGYSFRRSGSHALLDGQSLPASYTLLDGSQKSAITYPKENTVADVYYVIDPDPQQLVINYYDLAGKLVSSKVFSGYTDQRVPLAYSVPNGYVLLKQAQPSSYQFGPDHNELDFVVVPQVTMVMDSRTVTRTIKIQTPDGQTKNVVQTVKFVRNGYLNQVTKQTTYSPWLFGGQYQLSSYQPKPIDGYTADIIPVLSVTPDSSDTTVNVVYHSISAIYEIDYQLADGTLITKFQNVVTNDGMLHLTAPQGYRLLTTVTDVRVGHSSQKLAVLVVPNERTYTVEDILPIGVKEPLTKVVTRKVVITMPNGRVRTVKQLVKFERTVTVKVDGTVSYSNWQAIGRAQFNKVFVAKRVGYHLVITDASGKALSDVEKIDHVTAAMNDAMLNVKYVKD